MKVTPLFSIITVCLNSESTIGQTIDSVLSQSYQDFEYIIIDGKSSDSTLQIIQEFQVKYPNRIKLVSEHDDGLYYAMNKGIALSEGEIIGIVNSDDWYDKDTLSIIHKNYLEDSTTVFYGLIKIFNSQKIEMIRGYHHNDFSNSMIQHPTWFVPRSVYEKYGAFDEDYKASADYELFLRFRSHQVKFKMIERVLTNFRRGGIFTHSVVGGIESAKIKRRYGVISSCRYYRVILHYYLKSFKKTLLKGR